MLCKSTFVTDHVPSTYDKWDHIPHTCDECVAESEVDFSCVIKSHLSHVDVKREKCKTAFICFCS